MEEATLELTKALAFIVTCITFIVLLFSFVRTVT